MSSGRISTPEDLREVTGADFTVSEQQWRAISAELAPGLVIAGAGSGKTEVMAARVIYLVANELVRPDQVLGLTFTTKATAQLGERIRRSLATAGLEFREPSLDPAEHGEVLEPTVSTYNAYGASLLAEHGLRIGHESGLRVMGDASRFMLAERVIAAHAAEVRDLSDHPETVIGWLLALDGAMSEHLVGIEEIRDFHGRERPHFLRSLDRLVQEGGRTKGKQGTLAGVLGTMSKREELLGLVADYRAAKVELGVIDFSDQIAGAHELATRHPIVGAAERDRFRVVLLDEYQDTSVAQARLLAGLFSGPDASSGRGHAVMAVGDPNQAIYGWRGASVANIAQFPDDFPRADGEPGQIFRLTVNRRSDADILALANELAAPLYADPAMPVAPLEAKPDAVPGAVRVARHATADDELSWLAADILAAHGRGIDYREIGVLVRTNAHGAEAYDVLTDAEIPVEIVGLGGLIRLPEVAQVVSTLSLLDNLADNAALLTLLTGPRWEIGTRDLALLGRRSAEIAGHQGRPAEEPSLAEQVEMAVSGADPTEVASLAEALHDPGEHPYSAAARERFAALAEELRHLRGFVGEPLLDLLRRIMDVNGLDVELAASTSPAAAARRENLDLFVKAVADFESVDGAVTLTALNSWLATEDDQGPGLDLAAPSESDSVKLLTVHRAKGLEYDLVYLIGVGAKKFPNDTLRSQWTKSCAVLPSPLRGDRDHVPQLRGYDAGDIETPSADTTSDSLSAQARRHQAVEELRLGYVAYTRARHEFVVSSHAWTTTQKPIEPSSYQVVVRDFLASRGRGPDVWHEVEEGETNPVTATPKVFPWPIGTDNPERHRRETAAALVRAAAMESEDADSGLSPVDAERVEIWDTEIERLLTEARNAVVTEVAVPMPASLSATALTRVAEDPEAFARALARPMPRKPVPQARFGTRFHAWVESFFGEQQSLMDPDDLPGRGDTGIEDDSDLRDLQDRFRTGRFAQLRPLAIEPSFALLLGGQVVRGRIDAVFETEGGDHLIVDWKTQRGHTADPVQLAVYRHAWAELHDLPLERVRAAFYYVRSERLVEPADLPTRADLEGLLGGLGAGGNLAT